MVEVLIAIALSMDSAALCMAFAAKKAEINIKKWLFTSIIFAIFQAIMPIIGYFLGIKFIKIIDQYDHFVAFFILCFIGISMIKESFSTKNTNGFVLYEIIVGAFATSIDALAVGVTFAFNDNTNILNISAIIFLVCFIICIVGFFVGHKAGKYLEKKALILGGVILIILAFKILITHIFL